MVVRGWFRLQTDLALVARLEARKPPVGGSVGNQQRVGRSDFAGCVRLGFVRRTGFVGGIRLGFGVGPLFVERRGFVGEIRSALVGPRRRLTFVEREFEVDFGRIFLEEQTDFAAGFDR